MEYFRKNYLHICIGIALALLVLLFLPAKNGLTEIGVRTLAVSALSIYWWIAVGVDWVSLLSLALFVVAGTISFTEII